MPEQIPLAVNQLSNEQTGLNQIERVLDTYVAPQKAFLDVRRNASWWLPFLIGVFVSLLFTYAVDRQIGFRKVAEINVARNAQAQERMDALSPAQREQALATIATTTRVFSYAYPFISLVFSLMLALVLMVSFNFGLGAKEHYKRYVAVWMYASLPFAIKYALAAITLFAGANTDRFDVQNPVGTNIGWYLSSDAPLWLRTLLASADIFTIWTVALLIVGCATVAGVKRSTAAVVIVGWWLMMIMGFIVSATFQG